MIAALASYPVCLFNHDPQSLGLEKHPKVPIVAFSPNVAPLDESCWGGSTPGLARTISLKSHLLRGRVVDSLLSDAT